MSTRTHARRLPTPAPLPSAVPPSVAVSVPVPAAGAAVVRVAVEPADVRGDALRLHLGPNALPAVAQRTVTRGRWTVRLEVLAASHRVTATHPCAPTPLVVETVACAAGVSGPLAAAPAGTVDATSLPRHHRAAAGPGTYEFRSTRSDGAHPLAACARRVRTIRSGLAVEFPGDPDALTGLEVDAGQAWVSWRTWHLYPGPHAHAVSTTSRLTIPPGTP